MKTELVRFFFSFPFITMESAGEMRHPAYLATFLGVVLPIILILTVSMINQERKVGTRKLIVFFASIFVSFVSSVLFVAGIETSSVHFVILLVSVSALAETSRRATKSPVCAICGALVGIFVFGLSGVLTESNHSIPLGLVSLFLLAEAVCFLLAKENTAPTQKKPSKKVSTYGI